jgi:hypothetical protein
MALPISSFIRLCLGFLAGFAVTSRSHAVDREKVESFFESHCYECHDDLAGEGDLNLFELGFDLNRPADYHLWSTIYRRVSKGEMPPEKKDRPGPVEAESFLAEITESLAEVEKQRAGVNGRALLRRLSRNEYENTLRDLLALPHLELAESLPPEGSAHGYDKSAEALDFSHVHAARLMEVSDLALRQAIAPSLRKPETRTIRFEVRDPERLGKSCGGLRALLKQSKAMPLTGMDVDTTVTRVRGNFVKRDPGSVTDEPPYFDALALFINGEFNLGMSIRPFEIPVAGYYKIRVNGFGVLNDHGELAPSEQIETVGFYSNDRTLGFVDLPAYQPTTGELTVWLERDDVIKPLVASAPFSRTNILIQVKSGEVIPTAQEAFRQFKANGVAFRWFELEGPFYDEWPPESHRRVFDDLSPVMGMVQDGNQKIQAVVDVKTEDPMKDARRLMRRFLGEALRRPATDEDMKIPLAIVNRKLRRKENFMEAMISGYRAVLTSPDFLLMQGAPGPLDDFAIAERLSYFVWNSPPDSALRAIAAKGQLREPEILRQQVERLLADDKSNRFVEHFLDKWLKLEDIALTEPDANLYPEYTPLLLDSSLWETRAYFKEMLDRNLGAAYIAHSDFLMINSRLAQLYDIPGVDGNEIRKVPLPKGSVRGGLLTQASVLKTTANGTVTSPVVRGDYVQVHFLGDPPPPPPPAVPAVEPDISGATTIREQLARHSEDRSCAACHARIDPPGFALEQFDVMGGFRKRYRSLEKGDPIPGLLLNAKKAPTRLALPVDDSGVLPDGTPFRGIRDFKGILLEREEQLARNLLEQLVIYSTGAPVGFADRAILDEMMTRLTESKYGVRSMIHEIVQSPLFLNK